MSCSRQAAQSSSRSARAQLVQPGRGEAVEDRARQRPHVQVVRAVVLKAVREVPDRFGAHVLEQLALAQQPLEEDALAQARLGHLDRVEPALVEGGREHERAAEDHVGPVVLDALHLGALRGGPGGQLLDHLIERLARELEALHVYVREREALHRGSREVADRAADADDATASAPPAELLQLAGHVGSQRLHLLRTRLLVRQEALAHPHRAERPGLRLHELPVLDPQPLDAAAADVEPEAVLDRRGVDHGQPAVAGLLRSADHAGLEAGGAADLVEQVAAVGGVADRAGCHRHHLLHPGRLAEGREDGGGVECAVHAVGTERARLTHPGADPDRLADLVYEAPPGRSGLVSEHHEAPGVRPHVDDRNPLHTRDDALRR